MQEKEGSLLGVHPLDLDTLSYAACYLCASGEQNVSLPSYGQVSPRRYEIVGVIEDEQPASPVMEPAFDRLDHEALVLFLLFG